MTEQTSAELEREAERARARIAETAETIKSKLSAGQLLDEFTGMFSGGDGSRALVNLKDQIRDNPLPAALVGVGLAWLAFGTGRSDWVATGMSEEGAETSSGAMRSMASSMKGAASAVGEHVSGAGAAISIPVALMGAGLAWLALGRGRSDWVAAGMSEESSEPYGRTSMGSSVKGAASAVGEHLSGAGTTAADAAGRMASASSDYAGRLSDRSSEYVHRARRSASDLVDREPLILAGLGLALGTAIGAMLPISRFEEEEFGEQAERLRKGAEDLVKDAAEGARDVAAKAYDAVNEEADRQGLLSDGANSVVDRVGKVVQSAADATEDAVREKLGSEEPGRPGP